MTTEERAAFLIAQAAILNAEIAGMVAENMQREAVGASMAYGEDAFQEVIDKSICKREADFLDRRG
ncbi:MAG: hypothetical protein IIB38_15225 [Candidatus Hydrogenedentes bacterium]|nr:hypothetical protein [Candidatus Hydrogenedentota bacterium]